MHYGRLMGSVRKSKSAEMQVRQEEDANTGMGRGSGQPCCQRGRCDRGAHPEATRQGRSRPSRSGELAFPSQCHEFIAHGGEIGREERGAFDQENGECWADRGDVKSVECEGGLNRA